MSILEHPPAEENRARPTEWLKGHMRDDNAASRCIHLGISLFMALGEIPIKSAVEIPGANGRPMVQRVIQGMPQMVMTCDSPDLLADQRNHLSSLGGADIATQLQRVNVTLPVCRCCPFWTPEKKMHLV